MLAPMIGNPPGRTASSSRVRYLLVFWPVTGTGDLSDGIMVFVSFYAYWHWIVAGFLSPKPMDDSRLLYDVPPDDPVRSRPMPPCYAHEPPDAGTRARSGLAVGVLVQG